ncbi:MAG: helix-turn-helix transcriptional regulator [Deltaproteobacteria bacterium]|nr:helix-turn-helix transcriptional regulator [Deltaproteobacteria bacterium]
MEKEMMNTREVAKYLNINEKLVYKLIKERKIPGTRVTGKWTFPKRLVDMWITEHAKETVGLKDAIRELKDHIVIMGSNDFTIELLSHELSKRFPEYSLSFSNVGSIEGLIALGRRSSHIAGCHLLDPDTGQYNLPYIQRYLPGVGVVVINLVHRDLGLMVRSGNPLNIRNIKDMARPEIAIVNRQEGSGTRVLLDVELKKYGIDSDGLNGYDREVNTHIEVAMAVLSGTADVGLGILSAARMTGLEFIHMTNERYDLIIPRTNLPAKPVVALLEVIRSQAFKTSINQMEGYDTKDTGKIVAEM